jgi:hypothetical protein
MKAKALILGLLFLLAFSTNCEKERHNCTTCSDNITWDSYGEWTLQSEGGNGFSEGDNPINLVSDCGWKVLIDTAVFGLNVYAVHSCDTGVVFYWFDNEFTIFSVQEEWAGSTKEGIKMGDDTTKFLKAYPYFTHPVYKPPLPKPDTNFVYLEYSDDAAHKFVGAAFTKAGKLFQIYVQQQ